MAAKRCLGHFPIPVVLFVLLTCSAHGQTTASTPAVAASADWRSELAKALPWPIVAVVIALLFWRPFSVFLRAIGGRITKFSIFKLEVELTSARAATTAPLLDDIRTATTPAEISDSTRSMLEQVQSTTPADFATIALGAGEAWLTSRLYIAAIMMQRMRGTQVFVFVERTPSTERRLVAVGSVSQVRWALARRYPWLEAAFVY